MSNCRSSCAAGSAATRLMGVLLLFCDRAAAQNEIICPQVASFDTSVNIDSYDPVARFNQISGIGLSSDYVSDAGNPVLYGVSDIGGGNRLGIWDSVTGVRLVSLAMPEPNNGTCTAAKDGFRTLFLCGCVSLLIFFLMHCENRLGINVDRILWKCQRNMYLHCRYR